jgi:hypothetical protein
MTETELQSAIEDLCKWLGVRYYHTWSAKNSVAGWPDMALVTRDGRFLLRELKTDKGKLSAAQKSWIGDLRRCGLDADIWRPCDWPDRIKTELSAPRSTNGVA